MNVRLLKAKRVEAGLRQVDLAAKLGITEKAMNHKECNPVNKFKADEMLTLSRVLHLTLSEFDSIFLTATYRLYKEIEKNLTAEGGEALSRRYTTQPESACVTSAPTAEPW